MKNWDTQVKTKGVQDDPMKKIKKMIKDIIKLIKEAQQEVEQKDFYADDLITNQLETEQKDHEKSKELRDVDLGDRRARGPAW